MDFGFSIYLSIYLICLLIKKCCKLYKLTHCHHACRSSALIKRNLKLELINQIIKNSECQVNYAFTSSVLM